MLLNGNEMWPPPMSVLGKEPNSVWCTLVVGSSGKGRSLYIEGLDKTKSFQILPTAQQEEKMFLAIQQRKALEEVREQKVRDAYWEATMQLPNWMDEFEWISVGLERLGVEKPTSEQVRQAYNALDWVLVAEGIKWSFRDSVVRDNICEYFRDYAVEIKNKLNLSVSAE